MYLWIFSISADIIGCYQQKYYTAHVLFESVSIFVQQIISFFFLCMKCSHHHLPGRRQISSCHYMQLNV